MADNFFGITDTGKERKNNEDTFIAQAGKNSRYIIGAVIDGVGGYAGGEVAAAIARETILERLETFSGEIIPLLTDAFKLANDKILLEKEHDKTHNNMACVLTLVIADVEANQFYFAHIGDTRLYLMRDGSLVKISHDQSFVGFLEDSGRLTEKEAMNHPKRNEIDKALGFKNVSISSDYIETGQSPFLPGDLLLLCSDGLTDLVDKAAITQIIMSNSSLKTTGTQLVDAANQLGGKDNITIVLIKNDKARQEREATKPAENSQVSDAPITLAPGENKSGQHEHKKTISSGGGNKTLLVILFILVISLATVCAWQYFQYDHNATPAVAKDITPAIKQRNLQEVKLQAAINNNKGQLLILSDTAFKSPVVISQSIIIDRDSLHIKAKGDIVFQSDSGFHEGAFKLTTKAKHIMLDSLNFRNFDVAISGLNINLELKNMRFIDCKTPFQNSVYFTGKKYINGKFGAVTFNTDSLPKVK
jgi:serine/threonine protein phosphatase PrpC